MRQKNGKVIFKAMVWLTNSQGKLTQFTALEAIIYSSLSFLGYMTPVLTCFSFTNCDQTDRDLEPGWGTTVTIDNW